MTKPRTLLVDNGSLAPAATKRLRQLAQALAAKLGEPVDAVSLLHASAVPSADLDNLPAEILEPALDRRAERGQRDFIVLPLFFGPSRALTDYLPERVAHLRKKYADLRVRLAPPIYSLHDFRLARLMAEQVRAVPVESRGVLRVALVDHGSPARAVTGVRDQLAAQLQAVLGTSAVVVASSMERREGADYDFCEPLLEKLLVRPEWGGGDVVVAMQFLLPGRHAGPDGDVAAICLRAAQANPGLRAHLTPLVGEHPGLIQILADRWQVAAARAAGSVEL